MSQKLQWEVARDGELNFLAGRGRQVLIEDDFRNIGAAIDGDLSGTADEPLQGALKEGEGSRWRESRKP